jgi:hypothetical protein
MAKAPTEIRSLARSHTETAIRVLAGIMQEENAPHAARVSAAQALLDRGWGKPTQPIAGDEDAPPVRISKIELIAAITGKSGDNGKG